METNVIPTWHYIWKCLYWWLSTISMPNFMLVSKSGQFSLKISTYVWRLRNRQNDSHGIRIVTQRNRHFHGFFSTFDMDPFGKICRHHWKERLKINKIAKFENDLFKINEDTAFQRREILQTFYGKGTKLPPTTPTMQTSSKCSQLCGAISLLAKDLSLSNLAILLILGSLFTVMSTDLPWLVDIKIEKTVKRSIDPYSWKGNISQCRQCFEEEKNQTFYSSGTHFLSKNKDFDNVACVAGVKRGMGKGEFFACVVSSPNSLSLPFQRQPRRLRMTEQKDISPCYITKPGSLEPLNIIYFGHISLHLPDFDAFVWRLPSGNQANSQVFFRWMSKCMIKRGLRKFEAIQHEE